MVFSILPGKWKTVTCCVASAFVLALTPSAFAGGIVNNNTDADLRAALVGGGTVTFAADGTIVLTNTLVISANTIVDGSGHTVTISGNNTARVFTVTGSITLSLVNLTVADGAAVGTNGSPGGKNGGIGQGGAVMIDGGTLLASGCQFLSNQAVGGNGGNDGNYPSGDGAAAYGGAIYLRNGFMALTNCVLSGNDAFGGNSGGHGASGGHGFGGAIYSETGIVNVVDCRFQTNQAQGRFSGDSIDANKPAGGAFGGAICEQGGSLTIVNCQFFTNAVFTPFVWQSSGTGSAIKGGAIFKDGGGLLTVLGTEFKSNRAFGGDAKRNSANPGLGAGGAICNYATMNLSNCVFLENAVVGGNNGMLGANGEGGAIFSAGTAQLGKSWFAGNSASGGIGYHGGVLPNAENGSGRGGAVANSGLMSVVNCTFSDNSSAGRRGGYVLGGAYPYPGSSGFGGAIFNTGSCSATNCTLTGNQSFGGSHPTVGSPPGPRLAGGDGSGGGLYNEGGTVQLVYSTLSGNTATGGSGSPNGLSLGGGIQNSNGTVTMIGSIIADSPSGGNASGTITDGGHNISSDASCNFTGPGSLNNTDPKLGPADNYGGPMPTMALLTGSPAIDAGSSTFPPTDQRGRARPHGAASDIGAFESSPPYLIRGTVSGSTFSGEISVNAGVTNVMTVNHGKYSLEGLPSGTYAVTPTSSNYLFVANNHSATVGPDQLGVNFKAYRWNTLSLENATNGVLHLAFAGTNGVSYRMLTSSNLANWFPVSTNSTGTSNLFEFFDAGIQSNPVRFYRVVTP